MITRAVAPRAIAPSSCDSRVSTGPAARTSDHARLTATGRIKLATTRAAAAQATARGSSVDETSV
jgi:hypothetical protein